MNERVAPPLSIGPLPIGHVIHGYTLQRLIGTGGFSLVYAAWDPQVERQVAIKEYMPTSLAVRSSTQHVTVLSQSHQDTFETGLRSFVNEARVLGRLDHENLVRVYHFWEENNTAYLAMPLYSGDTVKAARQAMASPPNEAWLRGVLDPVLSVLEYLHQQQIYHRDISPDNILIRDDGRPLVLDFGAARRVISDSTQTLTAILKPHYAPVEQYGETRSLRQGPWTDLYALGCTLYYLITGQPPLPSTARAMGDAEDSLAQRGLEGLSQPLLQAIDAMMAPHPQHRPRHVGEVRAILDGTSALGRTAGTASTPTPMADHQSPALMVAAAAAAADADTDPDKTVLHGEAWAPMAARAAQQPATPAGPAVGAPVEPSASMPPSPPVAASVAPAAAVPTRPRRRGLAVAGALALGLVVAVAASLQREPADTSGPVSDAAATMVAPVAQAASSSASSAPSPVTAASPAAAPEQASATTLATAQPAVTAAKPSATPDRLAANPAVRPATTATRPSTATPSSTLSATPSPDAPKPADATALAEPAKPVGAEGSSGVTTAGPGSTAPAHAEPHDPRAACGGRVFIALDNCLRRECAQGSFLMHPECQRVKGICELPTHAGTADCKRLLDTWKSLGR